MSIELTDLIVDAYGFTILPENKIARLCQIKELILLINYGESKRRINVKITKDDRDNFFTPRENNRLVYELVIRDLVIEDVLLPHSDITSKKGTYDLTVSVDMVMHHEEMILRTATRKGIVEGTDKIDARLIGYVVEAELIPTLL